MWCLRVCSEVCVDCIDLNVLRTISLGDEVFGGELKLVMKSECDEL